MTISEIDEALNQTKAIVFKHSTRCPISAMAKSRFEMFAQKCKDDVKLYEIDVIADRPLSDEVVRRTGIIHHSPEVLFIRDGQVTGYRTHYEINQETLKAGIEF